MELPNQNLYGIAKAIFKNNKVGKLNTSEFQDLFTSYKNKKVLLKGQLIELMNKNTPIHIYYNENTIICNKVITEFNEKIKFFPTNDTGTKSYPCRKT